MLYSQERHNIKYGKQITTIFLKEVDGLLTVLIRKIGDSYICFDIQNIVVKVKMTV